MSLFLLTGIATLDIVNTVDHYPAEDEELRANAQRLVPGGNALNSARALAAIGHRVELLAQLADDPSALMIRDTLQAEAVRHQHCPCIHGVTPTSYVTLNAANGSRTIVHYRDLPELSAAHFKAVAVEQFDWLHFEGRNPGETLKMLRHARRLLRDQPISIEIEKSRPGLDALLPMADVLIFSRAYVVSMGYTNAPELLAAMRPRAPRATLVCAWGTSGAWALPVGGHDAMHAPAGPAQAVDTLGAGDAFNAGLIAALATGATLSEALHQASNLASRKVGGYGFAHLAGQGNR
ncbi:carbohydrate kinase [Acidihalobacter aeolianus]|uniref:Carbohydrate kinase n=1 Tax=Acidihalobacter aeolianus TaxID=2792603 RepID=A0A1D8KB95_9GAMM|nr:PfkB family carbohydrate kinase [Acidihalobacter aeolianus]AOV18224.1 carbohydrate kinase [Acidihalobacter aeolianus]